MKSRSRSSFSTKIHVTTNVLGNSLHLALTVGQRYDIIKAHDMIVDLNFERIIMDQRFESRTAFEQDALAWAEQHNRHAVRIAWSFTTADARAKLHRHYVNVNSNN